MSIQQAKLWAATPDRTPLDEGALDTWHSGEIDLGRALAVPSEALDGLRVLALSLTDAGKWARACDVITGLVTLGYVHPVDAMIVARACAELGQQRFAEGAEAHARRWLIAKGVTLASAPSAATLRALVERITPDWAVEVKAEWDRQRRLASTVCSFECLVGVLGLRDHGGTPNKGASQARRDAPVLDANLLRQPELDALDRVARSLEAARASAAVNSFPRGALDEARRAAEGQASFECVQDERSAWRWIEASGLGDQLRAASARARSAKRFEALLDSFVRVVDHACAAPNYCATRTGWHYPATKANYLARRFVPEVVMISEERWEASAALAERALMRVVAEADPETALEHALVQRFVVELGFDAARMRGARANVDAVIELVAHDLLIPLRALNETLLDLDGELELSREARRASTDALLTELLTGVPVRWDGVGSGSQSKVVPSVAELAGLCWGPKSGVPGSGFDSAPAAHWAQVFPNSQTSSQTLAPPGARVL